MARPAVDVVVPFAGSAAELDELAARMRRLALGAADTLTIVDNNERPRPQPVEGPRVIHAPGRPTPAYARNQGAAQGDAPWLLFLDADTAPPADLIDRLFELPPAERTALVAGGMVDEAVPDGGPPAARYAHIRGLMTQEDSFQFGEWGFPKAANLLCRRAAFAEVRGFREEIRAGEDADLTYRLRAAGWEVERREEAAVVHLSRQTVLGLIRQKAQHGAGGAWLSRHHPGVFPARRRPGLVWWGVRHAARGLLEAAHERSRDRALLAVLEPLEHLSFEFGRSLSNERRPRPPH